MFKYNLIRSLKSGSYFSPLIILNSAMIGALLSTKIGAVAWYSLLLLPLVVLIHFIFNINMRRTIFNILSELLKKYKYDEETSKKVSDLKERLLIIFKRSKERNMEQAIMDILLFSKDNDELLQHGLLKIEQLLGKLDEHLVLADKNKIDLIADSVF